MDSAADTDRRNRAAGDNNLPAVPDTAADRNKAVERRRDHYYNTAAGNFADSPDNSAVQKDFVRNSAGCIPGRIFCIPLNRRG